MAFVRGLFTRYPLNPSVQYCLDDRDIFLGGTYSRSIIISLAHGSCKKMFKNCDWIYKVCIHSQNCIVQWVCIVTTTIKHVTISDPPLFWVWMMLVWEMICSRNSLFFLKAETFYQQHFFFSFISYNYISQFIIILNCANWLIINV